MAKVVGIERVDYTSKKTNEPVLGYSIHLEDLEERVEGYAVRKEYVSDKLLPKVLGNFDPEELLGRDVVVVYNRFGSVERINVEDQ